MGREDVRLLTIPTIDVPKGGVAKPNGFLQHGGKYRLKITGGTADNLEHLPGDRCVLDASDRAA